MNTRIHYNQIGGSVDFLSCGLLRLEKWVGIPYTEFSVQDQPELECLRRRSVYEKIANFSRKKFKARTIRIGLSVSGRIM
jgi:hypothetical protein